MVKLLRTIAIFVSLLVGASPLLACLPNSAMTPAEMECCKKMAGNCDMDRGNHKCCDVTLSHSAPMAAITHSSSHHALFLFVVSRVDESAALLPQLVQRIYPVPFRASSSPPGSPTILRI